MLSLRSDSSKSRMQTEGKNRELGNELDFMAHACHSTFGRLGQKNPEFKASLDYIARFKKKGGEKGGAPKVGGCIFTPKTQKKHS